MEEETNRLVQKAFEPLLGHINLNIENFDFRYLMEIEKSLSTIMENQFLQVVNDKEMAQGIIDFSKCIDLQVLFDGLIKFKNEKIVELKKSDTRIVKFYNLLEKADNIAPNISIIILTRINLHKYIGKMLEPYDLFEEAGKSHGEHKARIVMRLFPALSSSLYENYIRILWELVSVLDNKTEIKSNGKFGRLINDLVPKLKDLDMLDLIEPDAVFLRNAAAHARYSYKLESDSLLVWDLNKPERSYNIESLFTKANDMFSLTSLNLYFIYLTKILDLLLPQDLVSSLIENQNKVISFDPTMIKNVQEKYALMFEPVINRYKFIRS